MSEMITLKTWQEEELLNFWIGLNLNKFAYVWFIWVGRDVIWFQFFRKFSKCSENSLTKKEGKTHTYT